MELDSVLEAITTSGVTWGIRIAGVIVALIIGWVFAAWVQRTINKRLLGSRFDAAVVKFFASLARYGIIAGVIVGCLGVFGIETASFAAVLAAGGLAIGLAFQDTLSNFAAGMMLLIFRPFRVDDLIETGGEVGTVDAIDLFTVTLDTPDNRKVIIPNASL